MNEVLNFLDQNGEKILIGVTGLYELIARIYPTNKNLSIFDKVVKFITLIIPNRGTKKATVSVDGKIIKETTNHLIK